MTRTRPPVREPPRRGAAARTRPVAALAAAFALCVTGCVNVKPYQRERLASPAMTRGGLGEGGLAAEYGAKLWESRTGGGLPGDAPGGGCGCTQ